MPKKRGKKKRRPQGQARTPSGPRPGGVVPPGASPPFDPRSTEGVMAGIARLLRDHEFESIEEANTFLQGALAGGRAPEPPSQTELDRAQELVYEAWESSEPKRRIRLAERAIEICPDCADAYVLLAEEKAASLGQARRFYEQGVEAGERALGSRPFEEDVGYFWGVFETRPYMRARAGLASCLWWLGERREAIEHYRELLRLNPNDNQGIRYSLLECLFAEGRDDEAAELMAREDYEDDSSAEWAYGRALLGFRRGDRTSATTELRDALEQNPHVPEYLLGRKRIPKRLPDAIGIGDATEAESYASEWLDVWKSTDGALEWLAEAEGG